MQIITDPAGKELKKHGDSSFPFLVSYERLSGYETGSFLWHWHPEIELTSFAVTLALISKPERCKS